MSAKDKLLKLIDVESTNVAEKLDEETLRKVGQACLTGFNEDFNSMQEWLGEVKEVIKLASLTKEPKNTPMENSANIKFPLITKACSEFSSRTYPEIIRDGKVVKGRVMGKDDFEKADIRSKASQSDRVCDYMNYQLMFESDSWETELDQLLHMLSLIGFICKKTYYDPDTQMNCSVVCNYDDIIINSNVKCLNEARRVTHILHLHKNELVQNARSGYFLEKAVDDLMNEFSNDTLDKCVDFLEQHRWYDLDDDGYEEPYIVTLHRNTGKVVAIRARFEETGIKENKKNKIQFIQPLEFFTDFHFLPSPKGKFHSMGFGNLMLHMNETINSILNMLIDGGKLANMKGGYVDARIKMESGNSNHKPGEWKRAKGISGMLLKDGFMPIEYGEPSSVLYQLLGFLVDSGKDLSSSTEIMSGNANPENAKTGAVAALIDQGMKVSTAIQHRIYRSLTAEFRKLFKLNELYLEPEVYVQMEEASLAVFKSDFDDKVVKVIPVADPNLSSDLQRSARIQALVTAISMPGLNPIEISKAFVESLNVPNAERFLMPQDQMNKPDPEVIKLQGDLQSRAEELHIAGRKVDLEEKRLMLDAMVAEGTLLKQKADAILSVAKADSLNSNVQFQDYQMQLDMLSRKMDTSLQLHQHSTDTALKHRELNQRDKELEIAQSEASASNAVAGSSNDSAGV